MVFTPPGGVWSQEAKLVGSGTGGTIHQGWSVALSGDGNTAIDGALNDNISAGAARVFTRTVKVWAQQGNKLVGTGAIGLACQGASAIRSPFR